MSKFQVYVRNPCIQQTEFSLGCEKRFKLINDDCGVLLLNPNHNLAVHTLQMHAPSNLIYSPHIYNGYMNWTVYIDSSILWWNIDDLTLVIYLYRLELCLTAALFLCVLCFVLYCGSAIFTVIVSFWLATLAIQLQWINARTNKAHHTHQTETKAKENMG